MTYVGLWRRHGMGQHIRTSSIDGVLDIVHV